MTGTLNKVLQKVTRSESEEWVASLEKVIHGYKRRLGPEAVPSFEILFGVKPRFANEASDAISGKKQELMSELLNCQWQLIVMPNAHASHL